jgi:dephospho-CoA kinase
MAGPVRIGLTGGIGSGKSTVAARFAGHGATVIDNDAIARDLTAAGGAAIAAIRAEFGAPMIGADGALDRPRMRALVFADAAARLRLEGILHPMIRARAAQLAAAAPGAAPVLVFDIPLLAEGGQRRAELDYDRVLVVDCPAALQLVRAQARATMPLEQVRAVMRSQASRAARLAIADDVLVNAGTIEALQARVDRLWDIYVAADAAPQRRAQGL